MFDSIVLKSLTSNEDYTRKVTPFLKKEYFEDRAQQTLYMIADEYFRKYNKCATQDVLEVEVSRLQNINESLYTAVCKEMDGLAGIEVGGDINWLLDNTEQYCQDRALHNGMKKALEIMKGNEKKLTKTAIPELLRDALAVGFDSKLGHDYELDAEAQYEYYTSPKTKIPFDIEIMNDITNGGVERKTLNLFIGGTHAGKTLTMCHMAAAHYIMGYNVLYITLEMGENQIRSRIDANLMNMYLDDIPKMAKPAYMSRIEAIKQRTVGRFKIREFPTSGASVANFRFLLSELKIKENFVPDIIYVDYLNICASDRFKSADSLYSYNKAIAEELRGFAKETNTALFTATQLNREGFKDSDPDMGDVSDSFGVPMTADLALILIGSEELDRLNQLMCKQEKNRYRDLNYKKRFVVGCEKPKMRWYDLEESAQPPIQEEKVESVPKPKIMNTNRRSSTTSSKAAQFQEFL
jgi:replicative DNA helicase